MRYLIIFYMERNEIHLPLNMKTTTTTMKKQKDIITVPGY